MKIKLIQNPKLKEKNEYYLLKRKAINIIKTFYSELFNS